MRQETEQLQASMKAARVVVADDHAVVRLGVRNLLGSVQGFEVVGEADDGDGAVKQVVLLDPDILLLDLTMPRMPGLEAMREIMGRSSRVKIILLTALISTEQVIEALQIGARGIVLKGAVMGDLLQAIRTVVNGEYWIGGKRVVNLLQALHELTQQITVETEKKTYGLTTREREVVQCIVEGCTNKDVAKQYSISEETVKRHLSNIFDKTGVSTRLELALFAIAHKLVNPDA